MSVTHHLWPDFPPAARPRGIRQMFEEAGAGLEEKTGGLVRFEVRVLPPQDGGTFRYDGVLRVPKIDYAHPLCRITTGATPFPAELIWEEGSVPGIRSEGDLLAQLTKVFQAPHTREVILNLMSLVA
jgi:hypothetical protein